MTRKRPSPINVLVVDDDPVDRQLIETAFKEEGGKVRVHQCENAEQALAFLRAEGAHKKRPLPDACILDINMPKTTGLELLKVIKTDPVLRKTSVVMMSSSDDQKDIEASYDLQAAFYVRKPENYRDLRSVVAKITDLWTKVVALPAHSG